MCALRAFSDGPCMHVDFFFFWTALVHVDYLRESGKQYYCSFGGRSDREFPRWIVKDIQIEGGNFGQISSPHILFCARVAVEH
jgi:hypothetical protein